MAVDVQKPFEASIPVPRSLDARIHIRLSTLQKAVLLSLTTASQDEPGAATPMGSFVYALPDRFNSSQPLSTTLFSHEPTLEFSTRLAKLLTRKTAMPVYVTNSLSLDGAGMGGVVEEEMEAFRSIVDVVLTRLRETGIGATAVNGVSSS